ncbi:hypothetical protein [Deinococcus sp.]|uniref:hypothetical protein n=1 Tax=Deinococcus sp. TaxID=47478 RepID=UPI0025C72914|nr:hypothetical protein [Deinococcus sp.]
MSGFLLFLSVPLLLLLPFSFGAGWLGRVIPQGWAWRLFWGLAALFMPGVSLWGYLHEAGLAAARMPQTVHVMQLFQAQTAALVLLTAGLTFWAVLRRPWLSPLPLPMMFSVFYQLVLGPVYAHGPYLDEQLYAQLDGATNRGLFMSCVLGAAFLLGLAAGDAAAARCATRKMTA